MNVKSDTLERIYPEHLMLELFGTSDPGVSERSAKFYQIWLETKCNQIWIPRDRVPEAKKILKQTGLAAPWDYQLKGSEIRFRVATDLAQFRMAWRA